MNRLILLVFVMWGCTRDCTCEQTTVFSDGEYAITYIYASNHLDCENKGGFYYCD